VVQTIKYGIPAVKDLYTKGINPLRCVVCQEKKKMANKMTCGSEECVHQFFIQNVKPDLSEERILK